MATGSVLIDGRWSNFSSSGAWLGYSSSLNGWVKEGGTWFYYSDGELLKGWQTISGSKYYLDTKTGAMATGWLKVDGEYYYFAASGVMETGWLKLGSTWYYLKSSGVMATNWLKLGSTWYYFDLKSGAMVIGWLDALDGNRYYFDASGAMRTGWQKIDGKWYNFNSSGAWTREEQVELSVLGKPSADKETLVAKMVDAYNAVATYPSVDLGLGGAATIDEFCSILYDEAVAENVRPELLFCQVMLETGWLRFGGSVTIDQFNFGGLGATGETGVKAASFESVQQGLRAQVQHLKAYSTEGITADDLAFDCVDPRFSLVRKGSAPYIQWLGIQENPNGAGWASSAGYGCDIVSMMQKKFGL